MVPLAALVDLPIAAELGGDRVVDDAAAELSIDPVQRAVTLSLARQATGVLRVTVTAPGPGGSVQAGEVVWFATPHGWVGLAPEPQAGRGHLVRLTPTEAGDLAGWLAPLIAQALVQAFVEVTG